MTFWEFVMGLCTPCLDEARKRGEERHVKHTRCVRINNTNICDYHFEEIKKEMEKNGRG